MQECIRIYENVWIYKNRQEKSCAFVQYIAQKCYGRNKFYNNINRLSEEKCIKCSI